MFNFVTFFIVPKDGEEHHSDNYEVLCGGPTNWVGKDDDHTNAIKGGKAGNDEPFYICQVYSEGKTIPGKLYKPFGCCYIAHFQKEFCFKDYLVLVDSNPSIELTTSDLGISTDVFVEETLDEKTVSPLTVDEFVTEQIFVDLNEISQNLDAQNSADVQS